MTFENLETAKLRFVKSKQTGEFIAFVRRSHGALLGVPEDSPSGKMICVLSEDLKGKIEKNVLYDCHLKPMLAGKKGYVVVSAQRALFEALLETIVVPDYVYQVCIFFGRKTIYFDPKDGGSPSSRTIEGVINEIKRRDDLADKDKVIEEFVPMAESLLLRYEKDFDKGR